MGGSFFVMVYVAVAILLFFQRPLLSMQSADDMVTFLQSVSDFFFLYIFLFHLGQMMGWLLF